MMIRTTHTKIMRTTGAVGKLNFIHVSGDSWWKCCSFCSLRSYCCKYGPDLFPLPPVRTSLLASGEALGQPCLCAGPETLQRGEERQSPTASELDYSTRASALMAVPGFLEVSAGAWGDRCCGKDKELFFLFFCQKCCQKREAMGEVKGNSWQYVSSAFHPVPFLLLPLVCIFLPSDGRMRITLQGVTSGDA